eukprot:1104529-Prymnesium_polylepis.1
MRALSCAGICSIRDVDRLATASVGTDAGRGGSAPAAPARGGADRLRVAPPSRVRVATSRGRCGVGSLEGISSDSRMGSMPVT